MKIKFEDNSYIEISKSNIPNKILLTVAAKDGKNTLIATTVELTTAQLSQLAESVLK